jgi:hypothetical protein
MRDRWQALHHAGRAVHGGPDAKRIQFHRFTPVCTFAVHALENTAQHIAGVGLPANRTRAL